MFLSLKKVQSGLYQQYASYDNNMYRLSTLWLSFYPKEKKHLHYSWIVLNFKKGQMYPYVLG